MRVLSGVSQRAGGRSYTLLYQDCENSPGTMAAHVAKSGNGLAKKTPEVAAKLIMEQFPAVVCVEVRAGTLTTKVLR